MQPYQQRVVDEKTELDAKIAKLDAFTKTKTFKAMEQVDREHLRCQRIAMGVYSEILHYRIARFEPTA